MIVDGMNFLHRARAGFQLGDNAVAFNFFRNLRALVEKFEPTRVYFCLEGHPKARHDLLPEYKANRLNEVGSKEDLEMVKFHRQVNEIVMLMATSFPVSLVRHADFECDDVVYNLIKRSSTTTDWVVVSNDSDFTQLLNEFKNVRLYNPMKKEFVEEPDYDYVVFKSLKGDGCDNIPGIPGIGEKTAEAIVNDEEALLTLLADHANADVYTRNYALIKLAEWTDEEAMEMTSSSPSRDWDNVKAKFEEWSFRSLLKEKTWEKFTSTFDPLFG